MTVINAFVSPATVTPAFSWTPATTYTYTVPGGRTSVAPKAAALTALTFTATTQIDNDLTGTLTIIEYRWDFGDGIQTYGATATHTYTIPNLQAFTVLRVQDSQGHYWFSRQQMYLS